MYTRLSAMMFLEFAVWGAWSVMIAPHMNHMGFTGVQIGAVFGTTAIGAILAPMIGGWIADRFMPSQIFTGLAHLVGAVLLFVAYGQTTFAGLWWVMLFYSLTYFPTIALTNNIAFHHMGNSDKFGYVRAWGTIGWIAIQFAASYYLASLETGAGAGQSHAGLTLVIAGIAAIVMGLYSFTLPNTPPSKSAKNPYAFLEAVKLMSNPNFRLLLIVSVVVAIELPFYYNLTPLFFGEPHGAALGMGGLGMVESLVQRRMLIGQCGELVMMFLLAWMILKGGMRWTIFLGILAWPVRYAIFAIGQPANLVIASQALHGVCYSFFFAGGMIAVERLAHRDIRASAQGLLVFATNGLGMFAGNFIAGQVSDHFKQQIGMEAGKPIWQHNWMMIWMVPIIVTVIAGIAFISMWNESQFKADADAVLAEEAA
jgi:nucleoside transporter